MPAATTVQNSKLIAHAYCESSGVDEGMLREIERHLGDATPGPIERDCGNRLFAQVDGEECQIGEAFSTGDARLWRHAAEDITYLVAEVRRLQGLVQGLKEG